MAEQMMQGKAGEMAVKQTISKGYKQTEVGVIPEDWSVSPLGSLINKIEYGSSAKSSSRGQIPVLRMGNLQDGKIDWDDLVYTSNEYEISKYELHDGDVLFNRTNSIDLVGKTSIYNDVRKAIFAGYLIRVKVDSASLDANYLNYFLNTPIAKAYGLSVVSVGVSQANINGQKLKTYPIPHPVLVKEQVAIASALSDSDALIAGLEMLIAKKQAIKTATMQQLLTGCTRLPQFALRPDGTPKGYQSSELGQIPEDWEIVYFGSIAKPSASRVNPKMSGGGDICIELEHISSGTGALLGETTTNSTSSLKSIFEPGDVLFGKLRAYLKKYILADFSGVCSTEIWVLKPDVNLATSEYIYNVVQSEQFINAASEAYGTHMPRADWSVVKDFPVMLPSTVEQTAIATVLSDMDSELTALEQKLAKARAIKQGMMQQLLTGRIRLPLPQEA